MEEVKEKTEEEIMRECLGEEFFEVDVEPEIEEALQDVKEVIDVESKVIDLDTPAIEAPKEEVTEVEAPKEEKKSGIDFAKRIKEAKAKKTEAPKDIPVENPAQELEKIETPEKVEEVPQSETTHQADIKMTTTVSDERAGTEEEEEAVLATVKFKDVPSKVFFKKGLTRNLGNFESYRVDVGIEMPCSTEDLTKYVLEGGKVVEHRLALEISKAQRLYGNGGNSVFDRVNVNL